MFVAYNNIPKSPILNDLIALSNHLYILLSLEQILMKSNKNYVIGEKLS